LSLFVFFSLLSIILLWTRGEWSLRPRTALQWYLLFSVVYYSHRWIFQWGPESTLYASDAPDWVRIIKDVVFLGFIALMAWRGRFRHSPLLWYALPLVFWFYLCGVVKLYTQNTSETLLYYWRYPLEYIPLAFIAFEEDIGELTRFAAGCCWIVIGFLGLEILSGRDSGFSLGGLFTRYGSIFGSPNDLGVFCGLALLGLLVFRDRIGKRTRALLIPLLAGSLVLSASRSAIVGLTAGLISVWPRSKKWLAVVALLGSFFVGSLLMLFRDTQFVYDLVARLGDESAMQRVEELAQVKYEVYNWRSENLIFGSWPHIHQEDFYLATLLRTGFVGAGVFVLFCGSTLVRSKQPFLRAGLASIIVGSIFVPHFDVFPANLYFWLMAGAVWSVPTFLSEQPDPIRTPPLQPYSEAPF